MPDYKLCLLFPHLFLLYYGCVDWNPIIGIPTEIIHHLPDHTDARKLLILTLKVLVTTIDAQWEGMGDVGSARYEPALLPPCPTIRVLSYSN